MLSLEQIEKDYNYWLKKSEEITKKIDDSDCHIEERILKAKRHYYDGRIDQCLYFIALEKETAQ